MQTLYSTCQHFLHWSNTILAGLNNNISQAEEEQLDQPCSTEVKANEVSHPHYQEDRKFTCTVYVSLCVHVHAVSCHSHENCSECRHVMKWAHFGQSLNSNHGGYILSISLSLHTVYTVALEHQHPGSSPPSPLYINIVEYPCSDESSPRHLWVFF